MMMASTAARAFLWEAEIETMLDAKTEAVLTIGHSTRPIEEFITILQTYAVEKLVDVRTAPRSRRNPQFNLETLAQSLPAVGISYIRMPGLGGLRHPRSSSRNTGWRNLSFRGYADYMEATEFEDNLTKLIELSQVARVAIMCAEALPWRCHRSLIADALLARDVAVEHIITLSSSQPHALTTFAKVHQGCVTYPPE